MTVPQPAPDNVFDAIAKLLKPEQREYFYRRMTYFRHLRPEDEMLRLAEAMGFLAVVIREAPQEVARERELLSELLTSSLKSMQASQQASLAWQKQMEAQLAKLPEEIAKGINAETIAVKVGESLRQKFYDTGLPAVADAMSAQAKSLLHASKEFSTALDEFAHPRDGAVARVNDLLRRMKADLHNAGDHIRAQMDGLGKEIYQTIAVLCMGALLIGLAAGILYQRWIDRPLLKPAQPTAPAVESARPSSPQSQPKYKKRTQSNALGH